MRPRAALIVVLLGVAAAVICWLALREPEPQYKGRSLSYWAKVYATGDSDPDAEEAIQNIGTNALPLLLEWIREPEPNRLLVRIARMLPVRLRPAWAEPGYVPRPYQAAFAFRPLGNQASPAVPELSRVAADQRTPGGAAMAMIALAHVGSNGVPAILAAVRNPSHPYRVAAIHAFVYCGDLGPHTNSVVSELIRQLEDPAVSDSATLALGNIKARPDLTVPALAQRVGRTNITTHSRLIATGPLSSFGAEATAALPYLTNALNDPDPEVRQFVAQAIEEIHRQIQQR